MTQFVVLRADRLAKCVLADDMLRLLGARQLRLAASHARFLNDVDLRVVQFLIVFFAHRVTLDDGAAGLHHGMETTLDLVQPTFRQQHLLADLRQQAQFLINLLQEADGGFCNSARSWLQRIRQMRHPIEQHVRQSWFQGHGVADGVGELSRCQRMALREDPIKRRPDRWCLVAIFAMHVTQEAMQCVACHDTLLLVRVVQCEHPSCHSFDALVVSFHQIFFGG
mmetsp:Transcript_10134/g.28901  ORF Transcript_10134/g.28901 Transcript_10134/m.28901 type:complete len:224 (-) Transcript_10134:510-1181(-)